MSRIDVLADAASTLEIAGSFLEGNPVQGNVILTLLNERLKAPAEMRAWVARDAGTVRGIALQSPLDFDVNVTAMPKAALSSIVAAMAAAELTLPAVRGPANVAARFAGEWLERAGVAARVDEAYRLLELRARSRARPVRGDLVQAGAGERDMVVDLLGDFYEEIGARRLDAARVVDQRLPLGQYWLWHDGAAVSFAAVSQPVAGIVRIQTAYTPPRYRNRGYAGACIGGLSARCRGDGWRCILFSDLTNPISNRVFHRIGFRSAGEALRFQFLNEAGRR